MKLVVATDLNNAIGYKGQLPWSFAADMQHFKSQTTQDSKSIVIMGRKTYFSIPEKYRPLEDRLNIVISTQDLRSQDFIHTSEYAGDNLQKPLFVNSFFELTEFLADHADYNVYCIGGATLYNLCLEKKLVTQIILSRIHGTFEADTYLKDFLTDFKLIDSRQITDTNRNDKKEYKIEFQTFATTN